MPETPLPADAGQYAAAAQQTLAGVAGLAPAAQVAAVVAVCAVLGLWIWTRRPQGGESGDTAKVLAQALTETAASMATMAAQNEHVVSEIRGIAEEVRGLTGIVMAAYPHAVQGRSASRTA